MALVPRGDVRDLDGYAAMYREGWQYRLTIHAPPGQSIVEATIRWVHIRASHAFKPKIEELFMSVASTDASAPMLKGSKDLRIMPKTLTQREVTVETTAPRPIKNHAIEPHHAYFWPHVELKTNAGSFAHDFKTIGLSFYG